MDGKFAPPHWTLCLHLLEIGAVSELQILTPATPAAFFSFGVIFGITFVGCIDFCCLDAYWIQDWEQVWEQVWDLEVPQKFILILLFLLHCHLL